MPPDPAGPTPHPLAPWRATGWLLLFLAAGLATLALQHASRRVSVDVLELLPRDEQDATIRLARQTVTGRFGRTLLLALSDGAHPDKAPVGAAAVMATDLRASGVFTDAFAGLAPEAKTRLQVWFLARRLPLRLPVWFDAMAARWHKEKGPDAPADPDLGWLAAAADTDLQEFQATSDALAYQERLPTDPLLLVPGLLAVFGDDDKSTAGDVAGGALTAVGPGGVHYALLDAEIRDSPLEARGQQPVFDAIAHAFGAAKAQSGFGLTLRWTGVSKFAADARTRLVHENSVLTYISLAVSCTLLLFAFRRVSAFLYLLLPIVTATVWSLAACFALFERVHLMTIIFTTVLVGVALDYGIYTLIHAQRTEGGLAQALRDLRRPLIAGCLTSVGGFVFMTLTTLPMLRQMGLSVALGLSFSLGLEFLYLPWMPALRSANEPRGEARRARRLRLAGWRYPVFATALLLFAAGLVYATHIQWSDDVRTLQAMSPALQDEQTFLRTLFGQSKDQHVILTFGANLDAALANVSKLNAELDGYAGVPGGRYFNLARILPTSGQSARCRDWLRAHPDFTPALHAALDKDFTAGAFDPFWKDWGAWMKTVNADGPAPTPASLLAGLREVLPLPLQNLWNEEQPGANWLATRINAPLFARLGPDAIRAPNAPIDQVETLNTALRRYRETAMGRAGIGLAVIALAVLAVYGWRRGGFMLVVPAASMLLAVGVLGLMKQPLGLLHVVALLLGFCLASDYSIFLGSPGNLPYSTHRAVLLAASTALLSFSVLSFSQVAALRAICLTVTLVIGFVLALCELSYRLFVRKVSATSE